MPDKLEQSAKGTMHNDLHCAHKVCSLQSGMHNDLHCAHKVCSLQSGRMLFAPMVEVALLVICHEW